MTLEQLKHLIEEEIKIKGPRNIVGLSANSSRHDELYFTYGSEGVSVLKQVYRRPSDEEAYHNRRGLEAARRKAAFTARERRPISEQPPPAPGARKAEVPRSTALPARQRKGGKA